MTNDVEGKVGEVVGVVGVEETKILTVRQLACVDPAELVGVPVPNKNREGPAIMVGLHNAHAVVMHHPARTAIGC